LLIRRSGASILEGVIASFASDSLHDGDKLYGYLDDSQTADGKFVYCAGYLFEPSMARRFGETWKAFLDSKRLKAFHATDDLRRPDAEEIFSILAALIKETALRGLVQIAERDRLCAVHESIRAHIGSAFSVSTLCCMKMMAEVANQEKKRIIYFVEDQGQYGGELRAFLEQIKRMPRQVENYAMAAADTYHKQDIVQLQAADLLAWSFNRSHRQGHWTDSIIKLVQDRTLPHTMGYFDPLMLAMVNSFYGMRSNRRRFEPHTRTKQLSLFVAGSSDNDQRRA
jgi:hypothetical protein